MNVGLQCHCHCCYFLLSVFNATKFHHLLWNILKTNFCLYISLPHNHLVKCLPCAALSWGQPTWQGLQFSGLVHEETHPCASHFKMFTFSGKTRYCYRSSTDIYGYRKDYLISHCCWSYRNVSCLGTCWALFLPAWCMHLNSIGANFLSLRKQSFMPTASRQTKN